MQMQTDIRCIVCPVDLSPASAPALHRARALARWYEAELLVLHALPVVVPVSALPPGPAIEPLGGPVSLEATAEELRAFVAFELGADEPAVPLVQVGPTVTAVVDVARERGADLIVMGTHGRGGFRHAVLGSTAESVLRDAPCPVLTVSPGVRGVPAVPAPFQRIVCAVDFSEASLAGVEYALALARQGDAAILLVHVLEEAPNLPVAPWAASPQEHRADLERQASHRLAGLVPADAGDWCKAEALVSEGEVGRQILSAADRASADVIVLGVHERGRVSLLVFGSTAHDVLRYATCPVLTVRTRSA